MCCSQNRMIIDDWSATKLYSVTFEKYGCHERPFALLGHHSIDDTKLTSYQNYIEEQAEQWHYWQSQNQKSFHVLQNKINWRSTKVDLNLNSIK